MYGRLRCFRAHTNLGDIMLYSLLPAQIERLQLIFTLKHTSQEQISSSPDKVIQSNETSQAILQATPTSKRLGANA